MMQNLNLFNLLEITQDVRPFQLPSAFVQPESKEPRSKLRGSLLSKNGQKTVQLLGSTTVEDGFTALDRAITLLALLGHSMWHAPVFPAKDGAFFRIGKRK